MTDSASDKDSNTYEIVFRDKPGIQFVHAGFYELDKETGDYVFEDAEGVEVARIPRETVGSIMLRR